MIVISDTTPVISLLKAGKLNLLHQLYSSILIPSAVYNELTSNTNFKVEANQVEKCSFISVMDVENTSSVNILRNVTGLNAGESESIVPTECFYYFPNVSPYLSIQFFFCILV